MQLCTTISSLILLPLCHLQLLSMRRRKTKNLRLMRTSCKTDARLTICSIRSVCSVPNFTSFGPLRINPTSLSNAACKTSTLVAHFDVEITAARVEGVRLSNKFDSIIALITKRFPFSRQPSHTSRDNLGDPCHQYRVDRQMPRDLSEPSCIDSTNCFSTSCCCTELDNQRSNWEPVPLFNQRIY
jgi:hypothetical protein